MDVRERFMEMIKEQEKRLYNPLEVLEWERLRMFVKVIPDSVFEAVFKVAMKEMKE
jgi:hypothetical protein